MRKTFYTVVVFSLLLCSWLSVSGSAPMVVYQGGTGLSTIVTGSLIVGSGGQVMNTVAAVAGGSVLASNGSNAAPVWSANPVLTSVAAGGSNPATGGAFRLPHSVWIASRNSANNANQNVIRLSGSGAFSDLVEFGVSAFCNSSNPFFMVGDASTGWLFQRVDADGRLRFFKQGSGEFMAITASGVISLFKGSNVASAATIAPAGNLFHVTGTTTITSVSGAGISAGTTITLIFDGALTVTDGANLKLNGNFVTTADDTLTLTFDGTNWFEVARSTN